MYMDICVLHVHACVVVCTCALVCAFMCVSTFQTVDTNPQVYYQYSRKYKTRLIEFWHLLTFFPVTCLQLTQCDVTVCTYNVLFQ